MKKIEYSCDRCNAPLDGFKSKARRIAVQHRKKSFKILLYKNWQSEEALFRFNSDELDLCEDCRREFDDWLHEGETR